MVGGDGRFLFFAGGMANADIKPGEKQSDAEHCATGISGHGARAGGSESAI